MSINKIHVNNSTKISLNDRFTVIQSVGPKPPALRKVSRRRARSVSVEGAIAKSSMANRKFLEQLEKKHKIQAALKLKRRSLKSNLPPRQHIRNRIGLKKTNLNALRLASNGKLARSNSLSNIATMKADLVEPTLRRSNSTSNIAARLGTRSVMQRQRLNRNKVIRSSSRQGLSRSNSSTNLKRPNSQSNLRRINSKNDLNRGDGNIPPSNGIKRKRFRSASRVRRGNMRKPGDRPNNRGNPRRRSSSQGRVIRGRIIRRRNSTGNLQNGKSGAQQGRISRPRTRNSTPQRRPSRSRSRARNRSAQRGGGQRGTPRGRSRGRGRARGIRRPLANKQPIRKEDLDKELDQYMANTKTALDKEMDAFMKSNI